MATSTTRTTMANGHTIKSYPGTDSTAARRVAAALPRGDDAVDRIVPGFNGRVQVWCKPPANRSRGLFIPEGYRVEAMTHHDSGSVCLTLEVTR